MVILKYTSLVAILLLFMPLKEKAMKNHSIEFVFLKNTTSDSGY